ncbi:MULTISPECIES: carbamate kinase [Pseudonocardia]|uniref:Carbamate kinase n=2 Tax=Pseudonocardia TaxID=1847 RepID=A0A1Y2N7P2_PSEAH|nr:MULTISPECIES: carbamate kinase [Pseudonocardia]OSY43490.1 Carbamate kinase 1 [Pseudonocardia autotrophica]TDN73516.1 carbamate kinase [Pseudonocardia autotrophica]BBG04260.1 carbamate kinase [Pseudonocardia autotrophica]GEC25597.1 carbamate kinase [Pseudonocardia saturnea]
MPKTAVVALGGNAITRNGEAGTHAEQAANARRMARAVCTLRDAGWNVVLVHGNGPQVGNLAIQQEDAAGRVPAQPLFVTNAMTQGQLGSLLELALLAEGRGRLAGVVSMVTHVIVEPDDPAFENPTKPVGPFFTEQEAAELAEARGWAIVRDGARGHRRVVPSPRPIGIVEADAIRALIDQHMIVVAGGGGGIPVIAGDRGLEGIDAVVDKDYTAQRIAVSVNADALVLVTDTEKVQLDFGTDHQRPITEMSVEEALKHLDDGQFPEGSMGPKVRAAVRFLREGGGTAVITTAERAGPSLDTGEDRADDAVGTRIVGSRT